MQDQDQADDLAHKNSNLGDVSVESQMERIVGYSVDEKQTPHVNIANNSLALLMSSQKEEVFDIIDDSNASEAERVSLDLKADLILETHLLLMLMASGLGFSCVSTFVFHYYVSARVLVMAGVLHLWVPGCVASVLLFRWTSPSFRLRTRYAVLIYEMLNRCLFTAELLILDATMTKFIQHAAPFWAVMAVHGLFLILFGVYSSAKNIRCCISIATLFCLLAVATLGFGLVPSYSYDMLADTGILKPLSVLAVLLGIFVISSLVVISFRFKSSQNVNNPGGRRRETLEQRKLRLRNLELEQQGNLPLGLLFFFLISGIFGSFFLLDYHLRSTGSSLGALLSSLTFFILFVVFLLVWKLCRKQIDLSVAASFGFNMFRKRIMLRDGPVMQQVSPTFFAPTASPLAQIPEELPDLQLGLRKSSSDSSHPFAGDLHQGALSCDRGSPILPKAKITESMLPLSADRASEHPDKQEPKDTEVKKKKLALSRISKAGKKLTILKSQGVEENSSPSPPYERKDSEDTKCTACMSENMAILFIPCNHAIFCRKCFELHVKTNKETEAQEQEEFRFICPVCRGEIRGVCAFEWIGIQQKQLQITEDLTFLHRKIIPNPWSSQKQ